MVRRLRGAGQENKKKLKELMNGCTHRLVATTISSFTSFSFISFLCVVATESGVHAIPATRTHTLILDQQ